jgi:TatD DNase family protein
LGFLLGIGGVVTFKKSGLQKVVQAIPLEHLVLETDAPYLAPVPFRGERNESSYIPVIARKIAEIKDIPLSKVAETTTSNALNLFQIANY